MVRKYLFFIFVCLFIFQSRIYAATTVNSVTSQPSTVGRYQKFELSFTISRAFPEGSFLPYYYYDASDNPTQFPGRNSPYGQDGISIDATFTSPTGKVQTVPAFYFQDFVRSGDTMTPTSNYSWRVRYAPQETGSYTYYLTITDKNGSSRYPTSGTLPLTVTTSSSKGFVRVSPRDSRFLQFDNGESFIPISSGNQWWRNGKRTTFYENSFSTFRQSGINFTRIWDQNDGFGLTVEGHFDSYKYPDDFNPTDAQALTLPKGTQMNQRGNYEEDIILQSAEQNGVYLELCAHGDTYWIWDAAVHEEAWNPYPVAMDNQQHINYWKRNYRYRIARWGYSTAIATWEVWNEHGHIAPNSSTWNFYSALGQYLQGSDPYHHLRTTSQGSQSWSPAFWASSFMDIANYHDYMMSNRYSSPFVFDTAFFVYKFAQCLRTANGSTCGLGIGDGTSWTGNQKPYIWAEFDSSSTSWNVKYGQDTPKVYHDGKWAGLFSPLGTTPIDWYYDQQPVSVINTRNSEAKIVSDYFKTIDYAGKNFSYLSTDDVRLTSTSVPTSSTNLRVLAMRSQNNAETYAWVQNKANARWDQSANTSPLSATFTIPGMANGSYNIEYWDTYTGQKTQGNPVSSSNGNVTIAVSSLTKDIAIKIISSSGSSSSPTPNQSTKQGDANGDNQVNGADYIIWLNNYGSATTQKQSKGDFNSDGNVNGADYILWLNHYGS